MLHLVLVSDPTLVDLLNTEFSTKKLPIEHTGIAVFQQGQIIVVSFCVQEISARDALRFANENYHPDTFFFLDSATIVGNEHRNGDIVLPNVFFRYDSKLDSAELDKENRDDFMNTVEFLDHYEQQGDYDFETFGLSVGGVNVSGDRELSDNLLHNLILAYEADSFDATLFDVVQEARNLEIQPSFYPIVLLRSIDTEISNDDFAHLIHILKFTIANLGDETDGVFDHEDETEELDDEEEWEDGKSE